MVFTLLVCNLLFSLLYMHIILICMLHCAHMIYVNVTAVDSLKNWLFLCCIESKVLACTEKKRFFTVLPSRVLLKQATGIKRERCAAGVIIL